MFLPLPFASKDLPNGQKLFRRKYGFTHSLVENGNSSLLITAPYNLQKINEAEIINAPSMLRCDFKVLDTTTGAYSGLANRVLNQFGFGIVIAQNYFQDISPYDAELFIGMQIEVTFYNPGAAQNIGVNIVFHEVA